MTPLRSWGAGKRTAVISSSSPSAVSFGPRKNSRAAIVRGAALRAHLDRRVERDGDGRELGPGRSEGERAADRAAVARLAVAGVAAAPRAMSGHERAATRVVEQRLLPDEGAHDELAVALLDPLQAGHAVDVDEHARLDPAKLHQLHEALTAREHAHLAARLEQRDGLVDGRRRVIGERGRLHAPGASASGSGSLALRRNSTVVKTRSSLPALTRSWIIDSPAANLSASVSEAP